MVALNSSQKQSGTGTITGPNARTTAAMLMQH